MSMMKNAYLPKVSILLQFGGEMSVLLTFSLTMVNHGCLPFTWKTRKFQLKNQMVRIIPFGVLLKLWASGQSGAFRLTPFGIYS